MLVGNYGQRAISGGPIFIHFLENTLLVSKDIVREDKHFFYSKILLLPHFLPSSQSASF
jgi:hypothetical protein